MSVEGYVGVRVVEGSVDGNEFFDFIAEEVVRTELNVHCQFS